MDHRQIDPTRYFVALVDEQVDAATAPGLPMHSDPSAHCPNPHLSALDVSVVWEERKKSHLHPMNRNCFELVLAD